MRATLTHNSSNRKTGHIPVSITEAVSCPDACPLKAKGCYANAGVLRFGWQRVNDGRYGTEWPEFVAKVAKLPRHQLWRHNQAGDLPGQGDAIDTEALAQLVSANRGRRGFTYTHKPMTDAANRNAVQQANARGFTI